MLHGVGAGKSIEPDLKSIQTGRRNIKYNIGHVKAMIHISDWHHKVPIGLVATCFRDIFGLGRWFQKKSTLGIDPSFRLASTKTRTQARASRQLLDSPEGYYPATVEHNT